MSEIDVKRLFTPVVHREDGAYWAEIPAMPGCVTVADTPDELKNNILEAMTCWLMTASDVRTSGLRKRRRAVIREKVTA